MGANRQSSNGLILGCLHGRWWVRRINEWSDSDCHSLGAFSLVDVRSHPRLSLAWVARKRIWIFIIIIIFIIFIILFFCAFEYTGHTEMRYGNAFLFTISKLQLSNEGKFHRQ